MQLQSFNEKHEKKEGCLDGVSGLPEENKDVIAPDSRIWRGGLGGEFKFYFTIF